MIAKVSCAALHGVDAFEVRLEVDFSRSGLPNFSMVGLAEGAVKEAGSRVFTALRNCACKLPPGKITVNLAPADCRKSGSGYDLPLALGLMCAAGFLPPDALDGYYCMGELSLTGEVRPIPGVLPMALLAREAGARGLIVPAENAAEAAVVEGLKVYGVRTLLQASGHVSGDLPVEATKSSFGKTFLSGTASIAQADVAGDTDAPGNERGQGGQNRRNGKNRASAGSGLGWTGRLAEIGPDFSEVKGQEHAKRAIEIAAAGGHNILFLGPPGSGKTMLAQRIPGILPPLSFDEALEVTKIYSVAGQLGAGESLITSRPFRSPHHTTTNAGLVGGTAYPKPGEVSLAHRGVLFLDELPEFQKNSLEVLRQPLEDGKVTISRAAVTVSYPGQIMLVAAMNPCPCGYLGDERHTCTCGRAAIQRYRSRLSGPLLDRIDLHIEVPAVPYEDLRAKKTGADSASMRSRVLAARAVQEERYAGTACRCNAELNGKLLEKHCALGAQEQSFLGDAVNKLALSARSYTRILRLARTIADLASVPDIRIEHLAEAVNCRVLDREQR